MRRVTRQWIRLICLGMSILAGSSLAAATPALANQIFMNIEGITGDFTETGHPHWIHLTKIQWTGKSTQAASSYASSGNTANQYHSLTVTKLMDKASPSLFSAQSAEKHFRSATIEEMDSARHLVLQISMQDVFVSSIQRTIGVGNTVPIETLTLQFAKFSMTKPAPKTATGTSLQSIQQP